MKTSTTTETFDFKKAACREWPEAIDFINLLRRNPIAWCWGCNAWQVYRAQDAEFPLGIYFRVTGLKYRGAVAIVVNANDEFDIYLVSAQKRQITDKIEGIGLENLIEVLDRRIESEGVTGGFTSQRTSEGTFEYLDPESD
jgi:hypothetical protein